MRIELTWPAWKAGVLPLNYTRKLRFYQLHFISASINVIYYITTMCDCQAVFINFFSFVYLHKSRRSFLRLIVGFISFVPAAAAYTAHRGYYLVLEYQPQYRDDERYRAKHYRRRHVAIRRAAAESCRKHYRGYAPRQYIQKKFAHFYLRQRHQIRYDIFWYSRDYIEDYQYQQKLVVVLEKAEFFQMLLADYRLHQRRAQLFHYPPYR